MPAASQWDEVINCSEEWFRWNDELFRPGGSRAGSELVLVPKSDLLEPMVVPEDPCVHKSDAGSESVERQAVSKLSAVPTSDLAEQMFVPDLPCVPKNHAGCESVERQAVLKSPVVPTSDSADRMVVHDLSVPKNKEGAYVFHFVPEERPTCFPFWAENYAKKRARLCGRVCKLCDRMLGRYCMEEHPPTTQCPPCVNHMGVRTVGHLGFNTMKGGPIEISLASRKRTYRVIPWTCRLHGMVCNLMISVEFHTPIENIDRLGDMWMWISVQILAWNFERYGFSDEAIVDVYTRLQEKTWDNIMQSRYAKMLDERTVEELSPAYKVVIVATWDGQLKVAGDNLSVIGDDEFEERTTHELMLYGEPSGAAVTIRKKAACDDDVFIMVGKRIRRKKLTSVAKEHADVEQLAKSLLKLDKELRAAWVAKMHTM